MKRFNTYFIGWAIMLALFNIITFIIPEETFGAAKYSDSFWIGYAFITIGFLGQLICAYIALKEQDLQKVFYNIPLLFLSYSGTITTLIFGSICMLIPDMPYWVAVIGSLIILAFNAIAVIKASAAANIVENIDNRVKQQTYFMKAMALEAQNLANRTENANIKKHCNEVYDAFRFSDPMSTAQVYDIENRIRNEYANFAAAVNSEDLNLTDASTTALINLISERNNKIKLYK